jgi:demethylmenaquinone methyltransferase/2-methoxy-6-polyprenyl-1,4-benzoquinol methylase
MIQQQRSIRIYNKVAGLYDVLHHVQTLWADTYHRKILANKVSERDARLCLDVGCGTGLSLVAMANKCKNTRFVGLDISHNMIMRARNRRYSNNAVCFVWGNAEKMPFTDSSFDAVTSTYGIGGVPNIYLLINEIKRILKTGGVVYLGEMAAPPKDMKIYGLFHKYITSPWIKKFWEFENLNLHPLLINNGFNVVENRYYKNRILGSFVLIKGIKK